MQNPKDLILIVVITVLVLGMFSLNNSLKKSRGRALDLKKNLSILKEINQNLTERNKILEKDFNELIQKYRSSVNKSKSWVRSPSITVKGRKFILTFNHSKAGVSRWNFNAEDFEKQLLKGYLLREYKIDQLGEVQVGNFPNEFGNDSFKKDYGIREYYKMKPFITPSYFENISRDIYNRYNSDKRRIEEVWIYVKKLVEVSPEVKESPRYPLETLLLSGGDCEDVVFLTASMLKAMPEKWDVSLVLIDRHSPMNPETLDHIILQVDTGDYKTFVDPTSSRVNPFTEINGTYIDV